MQDAPAVVYFEFFSGMLLCLVDLSNVAWFEEMSSETSITVLISGLQLGLKRTDNSSSDIGSSLLFSNTISML